MLYSNLNFRQATSQDMAAYWTKLAHFYGSQCNY